MSLRNKNIKVISYEIARQWQIDGKKFATPSLDEVIRGKSNRGIVYEVFNQNGVSRYYIVK